MQSLEPMPATVDRRQYDDETYPGYLEGNRDWAENNNEAVEWLANNHAAIREALNTRPPSPVERLETYEPYLEFIETGIGGYEEASMRKAVDGCYVHLDQAEAVIAVKEKLIKSLIDLDSDEVKRLEALIAEKDREIALAKLDRDEWGKIAYAAGFYQADCSLPEHENAQEALKEYRQLKADNVALSAQVKRLDTPYNPMAEALATDKVKTLQSQLLAANKRADELEAAWLKAEALLSERQP